MHAIPQCRKFPLRIHDNALIVSPSTALSTPHSAWVRPQRGRKTILDASLNLVLLDLVCDFEGHRWGVVWAPLQPGVGQCRPQAARRIKITLPPERGWYPAQSSYSIRCNTRLCVSAIISQTTHSLPSVFHQTVKMCVFEISGQVRDLKDIHPPRSNIGESCLYAIRGPRTRRRVGTDLSSNQSRGSPRAPLPRQTGTLA